VNYVSCNIDGADKLVKQCPPRRDRQNKLTCCKENEATKHNYP